MSIWTAAAVACIPALAALGVVCLRADVAAAAVAYQAAGSTATVILMLMAEALARAILWDLALVAAVSQAVGGLAFARFVEGRVWPGR